MQKQNGKIIFSKFLKDKKKRKVIPIKILLNKTNILISTNSNKSLLLELNNLSNLDYKKIRFDQYMHTLNHTFLLNKNRVLRIICYIMDEISVLIIGKPNVGKSTLFNNLSEDNISMVDDNPGTTVLPHSSKIKFKDIVINLVDVGGLKKKSKSHDKKQKLITKETLKSLKHSDIVLFLTEANSEFTKNDKQIFRLVLNKLKDFIIVVNKIDLIEKSKISKVKRYFTYFFENTFSDILIKAIIFFAKENKEKDFFFKKFII